MEEINSLFVTNSVGQIIVNLSKINKIQLR